ncbi:MAG: dodecin domain-containing protein [Phycisphaerales bacterium]|nr:dodecin domain-containing protein [Phycisphaerales bacterium]
MSSVAKVIELSASSKDSFEDAIKAGIKQAKKSIDNISGAWVQDMKVDISDGKITQYRVIMKVTFVLKDGD